MAQVNLEEFADKKVVVVHRVDGETNAVETEGKVEGANALALLLKPKGKTQAVLIEADKIEDVRYVEEKPKALTAKTLKPVEFGQARNHLLERHGLTLEAVNALSEKEAFEQHKGIDHVASKLGHVHGSKDKPAEASE